MTKRRNDAQPMTKKSGLTGFPSSRFFMLNNWSSTLYDQSLGQYRAVAGYCDQIQTCTETRLAQVNRYLSLAACEVFGPDALLPHLTARCIKNGGQHLMFKACYPQVEDTRGRVGRNLHRSRRGRTALVTIRSLCGIVASAIRGRATTHRHAEGASAALAVGGDHPPSVHRSASREH